METRDTITGDLVPLTMGPREILRMVLMVEMLVMVVTNLMIVSVPTTV